ncbi:MAG: hypothetical protein LBB55_04850, partial [Zoogloeaceae bacterium]|nr:hypothetical protein [Zoogloeaceae bacterium]
EQGSQAYREYNFSPSGEWAGYAFSAYRQRMETPCHLPAPIVCTGRRTQDGAELEARLPLDRLASANLPFHAALATVLEFSDGRLAYYALHHPAGQADFHHADSFILPLPSSPNLT